MGGTTNGNCASGFGVCCVVSIETCTGSLSRNCSYFRSPSYPSAYTTAGTCTITINRISDNVCQLRLDFETLITAEATDGACGGGVVDSITVTSTSGVSPPGRGLLCGDNLSGQHMYVEFGTGQSITWAHLLGTSTVDRMWNIKASQIECASNYKAPNGCTQYFTGNSGNIMSYNRRGTQLAQGQSYTICIRQEEGYCTISYKKEYLSTTATAPATSQTLANPADCLITAINIPIAESSIHENYCGGILSTGSAQTLDGVVTSTVTPFEVHVRTVVGTALTGNGGFELSYTQVPCKT